MKLGICIPTPEYGRYAACQDYIDQMEIPTGTLIVKPHGQSPAMNRNMGIDVLLNAGCDEILFLDDDVIVPKDLYTRLHAHDKDIVTGLYVARAYPHTPIVFSKHDGERSSFYYPKDGNPDSSLVEVDNCGLGAVLISKDVFRFLEKPYVRLGEVVKDHWGDDTGFFLRVRKDGFRIYCDLNACVGHMAAVCITPNHAEGSWTITYDTFGTGKISFPMVVPKLEPELVSK